MICYFAIDVIRGTLLTLASIFYAPKHFPSLLEYTCRDIARLYKAITWTPSRNNKVETPEGIEIQAARIREICETVYMQTLLREGCNQTFAEKLARKPVNYLACWVIDNVASKYGVEGTGDFLEKYPIED